MTSCSINRLPLVAALLLMLATIVMTASVEDPDKAEKDKQWQDFKTKFSKTYKDDAEERKSRAAFEANVDHINKFNAEKHSYVLGVNAYTDMTTNEFNAIMLKPLALPTEAAAAVQTMSLSLVATPPASVDWRNSGCITPVKDQGQCGSCWAFSSAANLEFYNCNKTGILVDLSEQNLVDCIYLRRGCDGGWPEDAFMYTKNAGGIDTTAYYPYRAVSGKRCRFSLSAIGGRCSGYSYVSVDPLFSAGRIVDESAMEQYVGLVGPLSVTLNANDFQLYSSGVYDSPTCPNGPTTLNHAVTIVGYGTSTDGKDYWLIKNSWGTSWGVNGYIMMERKRNQCGVANHASYPTV